MLVSLIHVQYSNEQPSIVDVSFSNNTENTTVILSWEVQCDDAEEVTNITYGCTRSSSIQDSDLRTKSHRVKEVEKYRNLELNLPAMNTEENWKCVFKLIGVENSGCTTRDSLCFFVDVKSFSRIEGLLI